MAKLRIGIAHGPDDELATGRSERRDRRKSDVQEVADVLTRGGHDVFSIIVDGRRECLAKLAAVEADLLFNLVELDLSQLPDGTPKIAGQEVKWQEGTQAYRVTKSHLPDDLPREVVQTIQASAVTSFQALQLRDYARFDFRITPNNTAYLIEANPNPYLYSRDLFIQAARASGRTHPQTILEIVDQALSRYGFQG